MNAGNREQRRAARTLDRHEARRADFTFFGAMAALAAGFVIVTATAPAPRPSLFAMALAPRSLIDADSLYRRDISIAHIFERNERHYTVGVALLTSDFIRMFRETVAAGRDGAALTNAAISEAEIGRFFLERISLRDGQRTKCNGQISRAGEDRPHNGVWASLTFDCDGSGVVYDASDLLTAHGARAWQVVTLRKNDRRRQVLINVETAPVLISAQGT